MEQFLLQFCHGCPSLEQPPKAEGFILLRPDGVQLEGGQPEGQVLCLGLIHRRAVQEPVQFSAQLLCLWWGLLLQHGAGDEFRVLDQAVQETQHLPFHPGRWAAAAQLPQFLLGWALLAGRCPLLPSCLHHLELRL